MAMVAAAPPNGWGMVGAWPGARIASVRALAAGQTTFLFDRYRRAIQECRRLRDQEGHPITVFEMALGGEVAPDGVELGRLRDSADEAMRTGINVVAAAGNRDGSVFYPAALAPVLAVGAADRDGVICSFSARGGGLDLLAPGCDVDMALSDGTEPARGHGTSHASAFAAGVIAALRAYAPNLSPDQAEQLVLANTYRGGNIAVETAFRAADLGDVVEAGRANTPAPQVPGNVGRRSSGGSSSRDAEPLEPVGREVGSLASPPQSVLPRPRAKVSYRAGRLVVRVLNRPARARVVVTTYRGGSEFGGRSVGRWTLHGETLRAKTRRFDRLSVTFSAPGRVGTSTLVRWRHSGG